jgi:hypothetical protein
LTHDSHVGRNIKRKREEKGENSTKLESQAVNETPLRQAIWRSQNFEEVEAAMLMNIF